MKKRYVHKAIRLVVIAFATYAVVAGYMFFNQKNYIYFPDNRDFDTCPGFAESEKIRRGGTRMYYTDVSSDIVVVYYHGNAGSACDRSFIKDKLKEEGLSSLFVEYAGYSNDDRDPGRDLILKDAGNAVGFVEELGQKKVVLMGASLGSAVAAYHSTIQAPDKIIFFAPFDSLESLARTHYPLLPVKALLRQNYDTAEWMRDYRGEVLIIHGEDDSIIPIKHAENLYDVIPSKEKKFMRIEGETHNTLLANPEAWKGAFDFIKEK